MTLNLYPSEKREIDRILREEVKNLRTNSNKINALENFASRISGRLSDMGLIGAVSTDLLDPSNYELIGEDSIVYSPRVDIIARIAETETDFDKMQYETKKDAGYEIGIDGKKREFKG